MMNRLAQDKFLRPAHLERYQIIGTTFEQQLSSYDTPAARALLDTLRLAQAVRPRSCIYHYLLVNGSTVANMRKRIRTLADYIIHGEIIINPTVEVVFLTGDRDLAPSEATQLLVDPSPLRCELHEMPSLPADSPKNEYQAAQWIWRQTDLPTALRQTKITFVNAAKQRQVGRSRALEWRRPNTTDTIQTWLRYHHPKPGSCLSLSHQPYLLYQELAIRTAFNHAVLSASTKRRGCKCYFHITVDAGSRPLAYPATTIWQEMLERRQTQSRWTGGDPG